METTQAQRIVEAAILCAPQPMPMHALRTLLQDTLSTDEIEQVLHSIQQEWEPKSVELVRVASGWRFQSKPELRDHLDHLHPEKPPKYSRATLETLAIIAWRQPVTRAEIEDIRGVTVNSAIIKQLEDRGWVETVGYKATVGRPALLATTRQFLDDMGLASLDQLPPMDAEPADFLLARAEESMEPRLPLDDDGALHQPELPIDTLAEPSADDATAPSPADDAPEPLPPDEHEQEENRQAP